VLVPEVSGGQAPGRHLLLLVPVERAERTGADQEAGRAYVTGRENPFACFGPFEVVGETDSAGRLLMSGQLFDSILVKRWPGGPGKRQRLTWNASFDPPLWTCSGCGSGLVNGILAHHDTCTEVR
jgi:hypothetical protein